MTDGRATAYSEREREFTFTFTFTNKIIEKQLTIVILVTVKFKRRPLTDDWDGFRRRRKLVTDDYLKHGQSQ